MQALHQPAQQLRRIDAEVVRFVEFGERRGCVARQDQLQQPADAAAIGKAEHVAHLFRGHRARAVGDRLVEDRQAVARRALRRPSDHAERLGLDLDPFGLRHFAEMRGELLGRDPAQVEALAARQHRHRHLVHFGRREEELHMLRRLLKSLQQRIESVLGKHVDFVDDVDLVARADRGIADRVDDLADVVDAGVRRRVHLDHVDVPPLGDRAARLADIAGGDRRPALPVRADAVQRLGDQPRGRGLADPAHARQQEGMSNPAALDGIGERLHHRILADQLGEGLRPVFARQHAVRRTARRGRRRRFGQIEPEARSASSRSGESDICAYLGDAGAACRNLIDQAYPDLVSPSRARAEIEIGK